MKSLMLWLPKIKPSVWLKWINKNQVKNKISDLISEILFYKHSDIFQY